MHEEKEIFVQSYWNKSTFNTPWMHQHPWYLISNNILCKKFALRFDISIKTFCYEYIWNIPWFILPRRHRHNLIGPEGKFSLLAVRVLRQHLIHDAEQLFYTLILSQIFSTFNQERIILLIVSTDYDLLWSSDGGHHTHLKLGTKYLATVA